MALQLNTLSILERWDCHQCTACCRGTTILLNTDDLARLQDQRWDVHPDYRGIRTVERSSWLAGKPVLAHQADGSCVFLTAAGRCRIHAEFGPAAKPLMCQQFPLQVVVSNRGATATVTRSCPSAAADKGRPLEVHLPAVRKLYSNRLDHERVVSVPAIARREVRDWKDFDHIAGALERLVVDRRFPLVRRLVHGLRFTALVDECKWNRITPEAVGELAATLEQLAPEGVGDLFQDRHPPARSSARLFRRLGAHFVRCVPGAPLSRTWIDHWRVFRLSGKLARARGTLPEIHPRFPTVGVDELERPLGPLADDVLRPLARFFESHAMSKRFALSAPQRSLVDSYRCLAFTFPMALWLLRWLTAGREPTADDMVQIVVALERGFVMPALNSAAGFLASSCELERMIAWYGR